MGIYIGIEWNVGVLKQGASSYALLPPHDMCFLPHSYTLSIVGVGTPFSCAI